MLYFIYTDLISSLLVPRLVDPRSAMTYVGAYDLISRLHMQVWQPGAERRACIKVSCVVKITRKIVHEKDRKPA